ncbi:MAG TPA: serine protease, peptidase S9 family protein, partial [Polyangia bacterium]|nr:serine protease, peptidase S9 family protein [Polyangia bacterium]
MKRFVFVCLLALSSKAAAQWKYPATKQVEVTDTYFGKTYKDSYRWLENLKDEAVQAWFKMQAVLTDDTLAKIPARDALAKEWLALDKLQPARYSSIHYEHGRVFYKKTLGGENVGKLYYRDGWRGAEKLLFDPATFRPKGAKPGDVTTIEDIMASPDGRQVILRFSGGGAEYSELRVLDVKKHALLPDSIYPSYGPHGWMPDGKAFLYDSSRNTDIKSLDIELNRKTMLHKVGTAVATDIDVFSNENNPDLGISAREFPTAYTEESFPDYVLGQVGTVQRERRLFIAPIAPLKTGGKLAWQVVSTLSDNLVRGSEYYKDKVYSITHTNAPNYKVVRTSFAHPDWKNEETVVPEAKDSLVSMTKSKNFLLLRYSNGIVERLVKYGLD